LRSDKYVQNLVVKSGAKLVLGTPRYRGRKISKRIFQKIYIYIWRCGVDGTGPGYG